MLKELKLGVAHNDEQSPEVQDITCPHLIKINVLLKLLYSNKKSPNGEPGVLSRGRLIMKVLPVSLS